LRWYWCERESAFGVRSTFGAQIQRLAAMEEPRRRQIIYGTEEPEPIVEVASEAPSAELGDGIAFRARPDDVDDATWMNQVLEASFAPAAPTKPRPKPRRKKRIEVIPPQTMHCGVGSVSVHWEDQFYDEIDGRIGAARRDRFVRHRIGQLWKRGAVEAIETLWLVYGPATLPRSPDVDDLRDNRLALGDLVLLAERMRPALDLAQERGVSPRDAIRLGLRSSGHSDFRSRLLLIATKARQVAELAYAGICRCEIVYDFKKRQVICDG
jgi:hypothetical protein